VRINEKGKKWTNVDGFDENVGRLEVIPSC
jgi:hypothetical protein